LPSPRFWPRHGAVVHHGHYLIFIVPFIAALGVVGMINLAVNKGRCRSMIAGGVVGFLAGVVLYLGHFYFGMIHDFGPEAASHPEALPTYIRLRMATEVTHDVVRPTATTSAKCRQG